MTFKTERHLDGVQLALLQAIRRDAASISIPSAPSRKFRTVYVRDAIAALVARRGFALSEEDGVFLDSAGTAVTVHGGRAHANNEVVWRIAQLAGNPHVRAVVAVVPWIYKGSACANKVEKQIIELSENPGVAVDLDWAAHAPYQM